MKIITMGTVGMGESRSGWECGKLSRVGKRLKRCLLCSAGSRLFLLVFILDEESNNYLEVMIRMWN